MNNEEGDDLIVSFAIECSEPGDVKSLILLRTPDFEFILDEDERGVSVSHDDEPEVENNLLRRIRVAPQIVVIESTRKRYELDISRINQLACQYHATQNRTSKRRAYCVTTAT